MHCRELVESEPWQVCAAIDGMLNLIVCVIDCMSVLVFPRLCVLCVDGLFVCAWLKLPCWRWGERLCV